jgi:hypothetical protein
MTEPDQTDPPATPVVEPVTPKPNPYEGNPVDPATPAPDPYEGGPMEPKVVPDPDPYEG